MRITVTGATGLIGRSLCRRLLAQGHQVIGLSRKPPPDKEASNSVKWLTWRMDGDPVPAAALEGSDAVVHLAGESIASGRWNAAHKRAIKKSRIEGTRDLVAEIGACSDGPQVLISGSAIGVYGDRGDEELDESSPAGQGFLAETCVAWEGEATRAAADLRIVVLRTGVVLSREGGALAQMLPPFRLGLGGPLGSGFQWMSWIHIEDEIGLIQLALEDSSLAGVLNGTAPQPATNRVFTKTLGRVLRRPAFLPVPAFALKILLGEMAQSLLLEGQRVHPQRALDLGFQFRFPTLEEALTDVLG